MHAAHEQAHRTRRSSMIAHTDPTLVRNQPSLRTSDGLIWIVVAGLFALISAVPLVLMLAYPGPSAPLAWVTLVRMVMLYGGVVACRFFVDRERRLRLMAIGMLAMAAVVLLGLLGCIAIEWTAGRG